MSELKRHWTTGRGSHIGKKGGGASGGGGPTVNTGIGAQSSTGVKMGATTGGRTKDHIEHRLAPVGEATNSSVGSAFFKGGEEAR